MDYKGLLTKLRGSQLIKDSLWSLGGSAVGRGLSLLAGIFIARFLGKDIFGEYSLIKSTILTIGVFSTFGLGFTATKFVADFKRESPEYLKLFVRYGTKITLVFSGAMALLLLIFARYVAKDIFDAESLTTPLRFLAVLIVFNAITTTQIGILAGLGAFKVLAKINGVIGALTFFFSVVLTYFWKFQGALMALLIVQVLNCIFNFAEVRKNIPRNHLPHLKDHDLQWRILKFSTPIALQAAVYNITSWTGSVLLVRFANFGELGMYNAAMQWHSIILFIPGIMKNVVLSHLSSSSDMAATHLKILKQTQLINILATVVPCILVASFSPWITNIYGNTFQGLHILIYVALISAIFSSIGGIYNQAFISIGKNWWMFNLRLSRDVGVIVCFLILSKITSLSGSISMIVSLTIFTSLFSIVSYIVYLRHITCHNNEPYNYIK